MKALLAAIALALAPSACEDSSSPVDPVWGKQACASCAMLVSDPRYAAELVTRDGARVFFDDPGCMARWGLDHPARAKHMWVRTAAGTWIEARSARFVREQRSPMNFGFAPADVGEATWSDVEASATAQAREGDER